MSCRPDRREGNPQKRVAIPPGVRKLRLPLELCRRKVRNRPGERKISIGHHWRLTMPLPHFTREIVQEMRKGFHGDKIMSGYSTIQQARSFLRQADRTGRRQDPQADKPLTPIAARQLEKPSRRRAFHQRARTHPQEGDLEADQQLGVPLAPLGQWSDSHRNICQ